MSSEAFIRCPRCGNENSHDSFACSFCGKRLRIEKLESIGFFRRIESEWINPLPWYMKIFYLFKDPARAFWDINHKRSSSPGYLILLINSLLWGLMGLAFFSHYQISGVEGNDVVPDYLILFPYGMGFFIVFFIFGLIFNLVFFFILTWLFIKGANYAVDFSERLETRFGDVEERDEKFKDAEMSPFSIYKGGVLLQKQEAFKYKMLFCAFAPLLLINVVKILIVLFAFPTVQVDIRDGVDPEIFNPMFNSPVFTALDIIDGLTIAIWVPILMTLGIRELANSSTYKVLISSFIVGGLVAFLFYFLRPTIIGI
ncbi:MAG: hypothetical protein GF353_24255 [Candidatus Lokiarchaeota archaeon]|nr:hypothetical protein [Candidatus Lokiarchaeota archaeon]